MNFTHLAYKLVRFSGLPFLFREILFRNTTRIVVFHDPGVAQFRRALGYLQKRYNIIPLAELLSGRPLPPRSLVITFDDGHRGNHALLGTFREAGIIPTIFVCAGIVGTKRHFWFAHASHNGSSEPLKTIPDEQRLEILARSGFRPDREFPEAQALQREQIDALKESVDIQSHSVFHSCLPNCADEVAEFEIAASKGMLEGMIGKPITAFAFANGDYCARDLALVKQAGYRCALTVDHGFNRPGDDPYLLKRLNVDDSGNIDALSAKASGVWALLGGMFLRRRRLSGYRDIPLPAPLSAAAA